MKFTSKQTVTPKTDFYSWEMILHSIREITNSKKTDKEKTVHRLIYVGTISRHSLSNRDSPHLHLIDIVNKEQMPELKKRLKQALKDEYARRGEPEEANRLLDTFEPIENFYFDKEGLHFFYNEYDIDCFGAGTFDICIDWPLPESVTKRYKGAGTDDRPAVFDD